MDIKLERNAQVIAPWGNTRSMKGFYQKYKESFGKVIHAEMKDYEENNNEFNLILTNENGDKMYLHNCTSGYIGSSSNATIKILTEAGFEAHIVEKTVRENKSFILQK